MLMKVIVSSKEALDKLLPCPECGKLPHLSSLKPEFSEMKYFCGVHISCGDWKKSEELALLEWNKRVNEFLDEKVEAHLKKNTPKKTNFIYIQSTVMASVYCPSCDFETGTFSQKDLFFALCMAGGYIISNKEGGYVGLCPECGSGKLRLIKAENKQKPST